MENLERIVSEHPFFAGIDPQYTGLLSGCARNVRYPAGSYIFYEGDEANELYLVRGGRVALEIFTPQHQPIVLSTVSEGEILGWSWLVPPYTWKFNAHAIHDTRAIALDGKCMREKCEENHDLGYEVLKRFAQDVDQRLGATRLQLLDVYAVK